MVTGRKAAKKMAKEGREEVDPREGVQEESEGARHEEGDAEGRPEESRAQGGFCEERAQEEGPRQAGHEEGRGEGRTCEGSAPAKVKAPAKAAAPAKTKATAATTYLGRADSMNASISLLLVDAAAAAESWKGVDPDDLDALEKAAGKLAKLGDGLDSGKARSFKLGKAGGVGFQLAVGKGIAHVFGVGDRVVIAEGFVDDVDSPSFLSYVAGPTAKGSTDGGTFDVASGVLAILVPGGSDQDLPGACPRRERQGHRPRGLREPGPAREAPERALPPLRRA